MIERLDQQNVWPMFEDESSYPHGMLHAARALAEEHFDLVHSCVDALSSSLSSVYDDHRITVVAFYSEVRCEYVSWEYLFIVLTYFIHSLSAHWVRNKNQN